MMLESIADDNLKPQMTWFMVGYFFELAIEIVI